MNAKIRMSANISERLQEYHLSADKRYEAISYIWARAVATANGIVVIVPHNAPVIMFSRDCFESQSSGNARLHKDVHNGLLIDFAASDFNCLINVHDHWFAQGGTTFSGIDDDDDRRFDRYLREKFEPMLVNHPHIGLSRPIYNCSLVLAQMGLDARLVDTRRSIPFIPATVDIIGDHFCRISNRGPNHDNAEVFDRQKDFIPAHIQRMLARLKVFVAGGGGEGSIVVENLGRLGIGEICCCDDDPLSVSNLNRWQGGMPADVGKMKVDILAERMGNMFPHMKITAVPKSIYDPIVEPMLAEADVIIGALDNDPARYFLNRAAVQYGIPYFDSGVAVIAGSDQPVDFLTRYYAVIPGKTACMACTQFQLYDEQQTLNAFLDEATLAARRGAGYVVDQPDVSAPSVYSLNQKAAAILMTELTNYFCGWRPLATVISEKWQENKIQRADRLNFPESPNPECPVCSYYSGAGDTERLPRPPSFNRGLSPLTTAEKGAHHG